MVGAKISNSKTGLLHNFKRHLADIIDAILSIAGHYRGIADGFQFTSAKCTQASG